MIAGITEKEQKIIERILDKYCKDYAFFYYGSRVKGTYEKTSDLDVLIKGKAEMPLAVLQKIKEEFDKSDLPYIVNFSDYYKLDSSFYERIKPDLISYNWQEVKLGDFLIINPTEKLSKGTIAKKVSMEKLQAFSRDVSGYELDEFSGGAKFRNKDTIMARITPCLENGKRAQINILKQGEIGFGSTEFIVFREKGNISDANFIYYLVCSDLIRSPAIKSMVGSSGRQRVQTDVLENLHLFLPPFEVQKKIAGVLGALDDKIELNNKINQNLEAQAQALFKSWFVDFEPFGGKMPDDWKIGRLGEIADITMGQSPNGSSYNEDKQGCIFFQGRAEFGKRFPSVRLYTTEPKRMAKKNDILMSVRAPVGDFNIAVEDCCIGRGLCSIRAKGNFQSFVLYTIWGLQKQLEIFNGEGTVFGAINKDSLNSLPITIPSLTDIVQFEHIVSSLDNIIRNNFLENTRLAELRDTLLPKLMSGEINVDDVKID